MSAELPAIATHPDPWTHFMKVGDFSSAWVHCDRMLRSRTGQSCWHLPRHLQYIWDGSSLAGKRVLVRCYHGLGDTLQFIRYVPLLRQLHCHVIVWAQPKLIPLLQSIKEIDMLLPLHDGTPEIAYDADVEVMELPHIFRTTLDTIPSSIPYLHVDAAMLPRTGKLNVGLVWKAGDWDGNRSFAFELLQPLFDLAGITFHIVQPFAHEAGWHNNGGLYPGEMEVCDFAKYIAGLDLLVSIDSMPVHLAGALGKPVWTLLQADPDWRWLTGIDWSPWYPTMKLFRQQHPGEWQPVICKVAEALMYLQSNATKHKTPD